MDIGSQTLFTRLIAMGSSSLLQYVGQAFPWSAGTGQKTVEAILEMAAEEREEVTHLTRLLQKKRLRMPMIGYPSHFTTINFCAVDYLVPKLIVEHEKEVAEIERLLRSVGDEEIHRLGIRYLEMKRKHLQTLKDLVAGKPTAGAA